MNIIHWIVQNVCAYIDGYLMILIGMLLLTRNIQLLSLNLLVPTAIHGTIFLFLFHHEVPQSITSSIMLVVITIIFLVYLPANRKWFWMATIGTLFCAIFAEMLFSVLLVLSTDLNLQEIRSNPQVSWTMIFALLIKALMAWVILKRNIVFFQKGDKPETRSKSFWVFSFVGSIATLFTIYSFISGFFNNINQVITFSGFVLALAFSVVLIVFYRRQEEREELVTMQQQQLEQVSTLFQTLRNERHDWVNHVQTVFGFLQAKQSEHALDYLKTIVGDIKLLNQIMVKDNPSLSALLQVKMAECSRAGIDLDVRVDYNLNGIAWKSTEMNVVIGNIINNAMEAFKHASNEVLTQEYQIRFRSRVIADQTVSIEIWNNGPVISEDQLQKILQSGYSTKQEHSGLGLASVQSILNRIGAKMMVSSTEKEGTLFQIDFYGVDGVKGSATSDKQHKNPLSDDSQEMNQSA